MCSRNGSTRAAVLLASLTLGGLHGCTSGETAARESPRDAEPRVVHSGHVIPPGTSLVFSVDQVVSTATHARGDVFSATLRNRVKDVEGTEAIPEGVPSQWIVTETWASGGATVLVVRLESIRVNGSWTPVVGDVTAAHVRKATTDSAGNPTVEVSGPEVAIGSEAAEVLADVLREEALPPGTIPTESGTIVTLTMHGGSATLPAGSAITVQLTAPLEV